MKGDFLTVFVFQKLVYRISFLCENMFTFDIHLQTNLSVSQNGRQTSDVIKTAV